VHNTKIQVHPECMGIGHSSVVACSGTHLLTILDYVQLKSCLFWLAVH